MAMKTDYTREEKTALDRLFGDPKRTPDSESGNPDYSTENHWA